MSADLPIQMFPARRGVKKGTPSPRKGTGEPRFSFLASLDPELLNELKTRAKKNHRSCNAEITHLLEAALGNESIDEHGVIVIPPRSRGE